MTIETTRGVRAVRLSAAPALGRLGDALLPAGLVSYCAFDAGGYFPDTPGTVAAALLLLLAVRIATVPRPFAGLGRAAAAGAAVLAALLAWTVASALWSDAPARALIEGDRLLAYGLAFVVAASIPWRAGRLRAQVRALVIACAVVCAAALASRLLPSLWPTAANIQEQRLSYPLTYWNALALLAAVGMVLACHLVCEPGERGVMRGVAAAAFQLDAVAALLTFSRGGLAIALVAPLAYLLVTMRGAAGADAAARRRGALALLAPVLPALVVAYRTDEPGWVVALVVVAAAVAAAVLAVRPPPPALPSVLRNRRALAVVAVAAAVGSAWAAARQVQGFSRPPSAEREGGVRHRLLDASSNGRTEYWRVAFVAFAGAPVHGEGAGTYQLAWARERRTPGAVAHAHSLYLETLAELGVVGLLLLLAALATALAGFWRRRAGPDGRAATALLVAAGAWLLHAGLDWDWQMPAVTIWLWSTCGAALARSPSVPTPPLGLPLRVVLAFALTAAAGAPALLVLSQHELQHAEVAYRAGRCAAAEQHARMAAAAFPARPEPLALEGFCSARDEDFTAALRSLDQAVARDPGDWQLRYDRAVTRALAGAAPAGDLAVARRLNPLEPDLGAPAAALDGPDSAARVRRAAETRLFLSGLDEPAIGAAPPD